MKYYIRVITGFREDQYVIIPMQEAHKAYYLFKHPEERGVFNCGIALIGRNIQEIRPEWNKTMGWNESHEIGYLDWEELKGKGVENKMRILIQAAKDVGDLVESKPQFMKIDLGYVLASLPQKDKPKEIHDGRKQLIEKMKNI